MDIRDFAMDYFSLQGKNGIVTGGNTGLGQAFALALAKAVPTSSSRASSTDDGSTAELIEAEGGRYEFMKTDIPRRVSPSGHRCLRGTARFDRHLDQQRGRLPLAEVLDFGRSQMGRAVAVNLTAAFEMSYEAGSGWSPSAAARSSTSARSSPISGASGRQPTRPPNTAWPASPGVLATSSPSTTSSQRHRAGYYATEITTKTRSDRRRTSASWTHIPAKRWGEPLDLMGAVVFSPAGIRLCQRPCPSGGWRYLVR